MEHRYSVLVLTEDPKRPGYDRAAVYDSRKGAIVTTFRSRVRTFSDWRADGEQWTTARVLANEKCAELNKEDRR